MLEALKVEFDEAIVGANTLTATKSLVVGGIWGVSITAILKLLLDKALQLGREHRDDLETAGKAAVDRLVALDLPWVPEYAEGPIDEATKALGYAAVVSVLDAVLGAA